MYFDRVDVDDILVKQQLWLWYFMKHFTSTETAYCILNLDIGYSYSVWYITLT